MTSSIGDIIFIDSMNFMNTSLEQLVKTLYDKDDKYKNFNFMKQEFPKKYELLCQKGHYPYEWFDNIEKINYKGLPAKPYFYSTLSQKELTHEEYNHALKVYSELKCKSFKDYHMAYIKSDVILLADIFENFRKTCMKYYNLDPANYLASPGLAFDSMLLKTGVELEQITDIEMLNMFESMKRGGLCFVGSKRYAKANNKYLPDYDATKESSYIMYWDANNLYGWAMCEYLPYKDLQFIEHNDENYNEAINTSDTAEEGYILSVDLVFDKEIHDKLKEFPPAPESRTADVKWLSDFQRDLGMKNDTINYNEKTGEYKNTSTDKLVPHLFNHKNYVLHYRNLKFLLGLGVRVGKVHRIIKF